MANPVVHFEMPYEDAQRVTAFYGAAFGWTMDQLGGEMGDYVVAETTPTADGRPVAPGTINGGFYPKPRGVPAPYPSIVIAVEDIQTAIAAVRSAGGEVLGAAVHVPGIGSYVSFIDSEGNRVSLLQPSP